MRTLLLAPELFTTDSGIPRMLRLYLRALAEQSPDGHTSFITLNDPLADSQDLRSCRLGPHTRWVACNRDKVHFTRQAVRFARDADLVLCGHVALAPVAWLARKLGGARYVVIAHGLEVWRPFSLAERVALRGAARVWCVSEYTRGELLRHCELAASRVRVLPNGLDPALAGSDMVENSSCSPPVILAVARLVRADAYKGIDHLINAMPAILRAIPNARLRIIGRGDDSPRLQQLAQKLGIRAAVDFPGYVGDAELAAEFSDCRVFALPSAKEGFGLVYLEAMAAGRPCLAAASGGAPEVVDETVGKVVPYGDVAAIATSCIEMLNTAWDASRIRTHMMRRFGYDVFRQNLDAAVRDACSPSSSAGPGAVHGSAVRSL